MLDTSITIALIAAVPPTIIGLFSYLQSRKNEGKIQAVHLLMNSNLTALLKASRGESYAEGREQGRKEKHGLVK